MLSSKNLKTEKVPVLVVTGFLGSGKTTIISHLLDNLLSQTEYKPEEIVYIKNEIGETDLDSRLVKGKNIQTATLENGCICCTLVGPFVSAIDELLATKNPRQIIIEASGVADPAALALMVSSHPRLVRECVLAVIDVLNFSGYKNLSESARRQAALTDLIVFNKVESANLAQKKMVVGYVRELNQSSPIVEAIGGKISSELVTGLNLQWLERKLHQDEYDAHDHLNTDNIGALKLSAPKSVDFSLDKFKGWLDKLSPNIVRVKGWILIQNEWWVVNKVGRRIEIQKLANLAQLDPPPTESKIICIGFFSQKWESATRQHWKKLTLN